MAVDAYALITLTYLKTHIGESSSTYDARLEQIINSVSDRIERFTHRRFVSRGCAEYLSGHGGEQLVLRGAPITAVSRVLIGSTVGIDVQCTATDASDAIVRVNAISGPETPTPDERATSVTLLITGGASAGTNTLSLATYTTLTTLVAAINALTGWRATVRYSDAEAGSRVSADLTPCGAQLARTPARADLYMPYQSEYGYEVAYEAGCLLRRVGWPEGHRNIRVDYNAGFAAVPDDVQLAAAELCAEAFYASRADPTMQGEKIGNYEYQRAGGPGGMAALLSASIAARFGPWKRPIC